MSVMFTEALRAGRVFGDTGTDEYVYMPAGEIGAEKALCVYEAAERREDVTMDEALRLIRVRSLRPVHHPRLGESSC